MSARHNLKDHEIAALVSALTITGQVYGSTQQLRERIRADITAALGQPEPTNSARSTTTVTVEILREEGAPAESLEDVVKSWAKRNPFGVRVLGRPKE